MIDDNDGNPRPGAPAPAFAIWMGQWRLSTLDTQGCSFVLRFLLRAFRSRRAEDKFWDFLQLFFRGGDHRGGPANGDGRIRTAKDLLTLAVALPANDARSLLAYLSECYAAEGDRSFWNVVSEAIELYTVAPYNSQSSQIA